MKSYLEATARQRLANVLDADSWQEFCAPSKASISPHLAQLDAPVSFDDGIVIGRGQLQGHTVFAAAQEGGFMGGAIGEIHGAKLVGLLRLAVQEKPQAVVLLLESGGVRLHEANAGLIAVAEIMRALFDVRAAGIAVLVLIGGANGCFGGAGIIARCANFIIMSELARLAMSGPEVIESVQGVEEFDARDKALVWRTTGGKHRYLLGDCDVLVEDDCAAFCQAAADFLQSSCAPIGLSLASLEQEQASLQQRLQTFGECTEPMQIWQALGVSQPEQIPVLDSAQFLALCAPRKANFAQSSVPAALVQEGL